ncbi:TULIP family P47-like protein [Aliiruegeria sabulilitoris]|uniref:TULIP family P47-like protein n=1 Tax=Aliiruegeria sabulilitoris TaxID=1510458 RepID=UPI000833EC02|nr:TULIP family P47-like protein [Aliiruegeria sabulilitoris]NDR56715.1 hypothetical protein [Pseudoruegeria sp. M32A2M]
MSGLTELDLQGWDVVNAALYSSVNDAIATQNKMPPGFDQTDTGTGKSLNGKWKTWEVVPGGSGAQLRMKMTIASGHASDTAFPSFSKLDPVTVGGLTVGISGLAVINPSPAKTAIGSAFGDNARSSGKFYFEVTNDGSVNTQISDIVFVGVSPKGSRDAEFFLAQNAFGMRTDGAVITKGAPGQAVPAADWDTKGSVVGVAVDLDNGLLWFKTPSGAWRTAGADPAKGTGADATLGSGVDYVPAVCVRTDAKVTVNFGASPLVNMPPLGFVSGWPAPSGKSGVDLAGATATVLITLAKVPGPNGVPQLMAGSEKGATLPAAMVDTFTDANGKDLESEYGGALKTWLAANLTTFKNVFHIVDASGQVAGAKNTGYEWLAPKGGFDYAVADEPGGTTGVLAVMSLIEDLAPGETGPQQAIPPEIVSYMKGQQNAVMVLSNEQVVSQILWRAAPSLVKKGATGQDFIVAADGRSVSNNKALDWQDINLPDGTTITPNIPVGGLTLKVDGRKIRISFEKLTFTHPMVVLGGNEIVDFSFNQELYLILHDGPNDDDGNPTQILYPTFADPQDQTAKDAPQILDLSVTSHLDHDAQRNKRIELISGIVLAALSVGLAMFSAGSFVIKSARAARLVAAAGNEVQLGNLPAGYGPPPMAVVDGIYGNAPLAIQMDGAGIPFLSKLAVGSGVLSGIAALGSGASWTLWGITKATISDEDFSQVSTQLSVQSFIEKAMAKFIWPSTTEWKLDEIELDGSLIFKGKLS